MRAAAGRATAAASAGGASDEDRRALERCARGDPSGRVAAQCRTPAVPAPARTRPTLVYVVAEGAAAPRPGAPFALVFADGTVRLGETDRRGAVFDPVAPEGEVRLSSGR